jgi:hypothetical protein
MKQVLLIGLYLSCSGMFGQCTSTRDAILHNLNNKIHLQQNLIVHIFVPLCDNEHQGIVPTSPKLGNGLDLKNNLYWATSGGIKRFFNDHPKWNFVCSILSPTKNILERVVFSRTFTNGACVYLVADAYRGDQMAKCLSDFFNSLSGQFQHAISIDSLKLTINSGADLLIFNGHNGLMDTPLNFTPITPQQFPMIDAVSISCASANLFKYHYPQTNAYPLVHTTNLLYPGAFIANAIIENWAMLKSDKECKIAASKAYYEHKPNSGPNGSQNLFDYGW